MRWTSLLVLLCCSTVALLLIAGCSFDSPILRALPVQDAASDQAGLVDQEVNDGWQPDARQADTAADQGGQLVDGPLADALQPDSQQPDSQQPDSQQPDSQQPDTGPSCDDLSCAFGCDSQLARCRRLTPSNFSPATFFDLLGLPAETPARFDTSSGAVYDENGSELRPPGNPGQVINGIYWGTNTQDPDLPELAIFGLRSLSISSGVTVTIEGDRAFALYAAESSVIAGTISATATGRQGGPGGFEGGLSDGGDGEACRGGQGLGGSKSGDAESGGGGGGRGSSGGAGGNAAGGLPGGSGGIPVGMVSLTPLFGGCGGGGGVDGDGGQGGGGGGAIQISVNGDLTVSGVISAGGGRGRGSGGHSDSGGGGGAGGAILLEGARIEVSGLLAANGGGGGGGGDGSSSGQPGQPEVLAASGGDAGNAGGAGGNGGYLTIPGGATGENGLHAGGGGGGVGRIRINATEYLPISQSASPEPSVSLPYGGW